MSTEPEDVLEEALRGDLPPPDTEARVRRRLLAAGIAVGNGVASTTAAAAGAGATAAKIAGLSWGLKLGLAAAVAIPTVGLLLDNRDERSGRVEAPSVATGRPSNAPTNEATPAPPAPAAAVPATEPAARTPERTPARAARAPVSDAAASNVPAMPARPSQSDFTAAEPAAPPPHVSSSLAEETRLLDNAFAELTTGNLARAAVLIREHEARFPAGLLQKERERAKARLSELSRGE
jgi:hypothetical protein